MSLEATHIRFALAIKEDLRVLDLEKYVAGAIYPDTRYLTGVNRALTHDFGYFTGGKKLTDFEKGWLVHIVGDKVFYEVIDDKFSELVLSEGYQERWPIISAIKIIQDIADFLSFDFQSVSDYLDYYEIHFHEDERRVVEYNGIIRKMYEGKEKVIVEDALWMWKKLGMTSAELALLKKKLIELYEDEKLIADIGRNFEDGLKIYERKYRELMEGYK
ncbi:MAG: hypothetical protein PHX30_06365 [Candidatus Pacebacteria bacterium]|nr:hypothetical protein [Candidatus Paceibacterota bacterium]